MNISSGEFVVTNFTIKREEDYYRVRIAGMPQPSIREPSQRVMSAAVAEFGMLLRRSQHKGTATFADVLALARAMRGPDLEGYREEFSRMVETSRAISGPQAVARQ